MLDLEADVEEKPGVTAEVTPPVPVVEAPVPEVTSPPSPNVPPNPAARGPMTFDDMVVTPEKAQALNARMLELKRQQAAQSGAVNDETVRRLRADRAEMERAFRATELDPNDLQPWDQKAKQNEYRTDPVEAFGSVGSVFAMLASSFAGVPMEYALNAGAAAIQAVHAGDEKAYQRDFEAWKTNTDLALKRHNVVRQHYNDAILKMNTNLNAGRSELEMAARKFGDQQAIAMLEAGLDKDLNDLITGRNKAALELQSTADQVWLQHEKTMDLKNDPRWLSGNPALKQQAVQEWQERWRAGGRAQLSYDFKKDYIESQKKAKPDYTPDDLLRWGQEATEAETKGRPTGVGASQAAEIERRTADYESQGMPRADAFDRATREVKAAATIQRPLPYDSEADFMRAKEREFPNATAADRAAWKREWSEAESAKSAGTGGKLTGPQERQRKVNLIKEEVQKENPDWTPVQIEREAERRFRVDFPAPLTSSQQGRYEDRVFLADDTLADLNKEIALLQKRSGLTGAGGVLSRGKERIGNLFGSNTTEAQDFYKTLQKMRLNAGRMLTLSQGRPLASEAARINDVLAGSQIGDLTAPTLSAFRAYEEFVKKFKADAANRLQGQPTPSMGGPGAPATPAAPTKKPWERDPIVTPGPRSSLDDGAVLSDADTELLVPGAQYAMMPPAAVSKPVMVQRPTPLQRMEQGVDELDDIAEQLSPRMYNKLIAYARRLSPNARGGPR